MTVLNEYVVSFAARAFSALAGVAGDRSGATAVEYGIIVAGIAVTIIAAVSLVGEQMEILFNTISNAMETATTP